MLGPLLTHEWAAYLFSYGGILVDLSIVPLLLWRRTRWIGLAVAVVFNVLNSLIFSIGIFPWLMIASTLMFFEPDWPRRLVARLLGWVGRCPVELGPEAGRPPRPSIGRPQHIVAGLLAVWVAVQILVPLRHHFYPGDVAWTEEGHRFSWRMKLRDKQGAADFLATDPGRGLTWRIDPREYVADWQVEEMAARPDMVIQLAHRIADDMRRRGYGQVEVRTRAFASLNGRWPQALIDPRVDLTTRERSLLPADWIVPLSEPLRR
jgi:Vitamin K-dependent gamma-carboxylase, lumenal domain/HTTM domain